MQPSDNNNADITPNLPERYEVLKELGAGGMSRVYQAVDNLLQKEVAIKILHLGYLADAKNFMRFQQEAKITGQLKHQNIVSILDFGMTGSEEGGQPYLVMDYIPGQSLDQLLSRYGPLPIAESMPLIFEILAAVKYAHSQNVLHRDLKPSNILIAENPDDEAVVKLIDFGIARLADPDQHLTTSGGIHGTPAYMSPEQAQGKPLSNRSEIYSLGCVLFAIWTGRPPFQAETVLEVLNHHCEKQPPHLGSINPSLDPDTELNPQKKAVLEGLDQVVSNCLEKDPDKRISSVAELEENLIKLDEAYATGATTSNALPESQNNTKSIFVTLVPVTVLLIGLMMAFTFAVGKHAQPEQSKIVKKTRPISESASGLKAVVKIVDKHASRLFRSEKAKDTNQTMLYSYKLAIEELEDKDFAEIGSRTDYQILKIRLKHKVTGSGLRYIKNKNLTTLDLADISLTEDGWKAISQLKTVEELDVSQSKTFQSRFIKYLAKLPKLQHLHIPLNDLNTNDFAKIGTISTITLINLNGNKSKSQPHCKTLPPGALQGLAKNKKLQYYSFRAVSLKPSDLTALRKTKNIHFSFTLLPLSEELIMKLNDLQVESILFDNIPELSLEAVLKLRLSNLKTLSIINCNKIRRSNSPEIRKAFQNTIVEVRDYDPNKK